MTLHRACLLCLVFGRVGAALPRQLLVHLPEQLDVASVPAVARIIGQELLLELDLGLLSPGAKRQLHRLAKYMARF